jgi:GT2 family glycosyltransferase
MPETIGICIITHQRAELLRRCVDNIRKYTELPYKLFVAIDRSTDNTVKYLESEGIDYEMSPKPGISANRSVAFHGIKDCDILCQFEDDSCPVKHGWLERDIQAMDETGFSYLLHLGDYHGTVQQNYNYSGGSVVTRPLSSTQLISIKKKVLDTIGYFSPEFEDFYGFEEAEWGNRAIRSGFAPGWASRIDGGDDVFMDWHCPHADMINSHRRSEDVARNDAVWNNIRNSGRMYVPYPFES